MITFFAFYGIMIFGVGYAIGEWSERRRWTKKLASNGKEDRNERE